MKMIKVYGSALCPDCVRCKEDLDKAGIPYVYLDFADRLLNLKTFLKLRDSNEVFDEVKKNGFIGIPCIVLEDGTVTLEWDSLINKESNQG